MTYVDIHLINDGAWFQKQFPVTLIPVPHDFLSTQGPATVSTFWLNGNLGQTHHPTYWVFSLQQYSCPSLGVDEWMKQKKIKWNNGWKVCPVNCKVLYTWVVLFVALVITQGPWAPGKSLWSISHSQWKETADAPSWCCWYRANSMAGMRVHSLLSPRVVELPWSGLLIYLTIWKLC